MNLDRAHGRIDRWLGVLLVVALLVSLLPGLVAPQPAAAATTSLTVTKYDAHGNVLGTQTVDYTWMEANLPVQGDGTIRYYAQGPTFTNTDFNAVWNPAEDVNVESRDYGRPKGTDVKDLCNLVGGATAGCTVKIKAADNFYKWFDYEDIYNPEPRQGKLVICWYNEDYGGYVPTYDTGMRLLFFADTTVNPNGWHAFGDWDMHETLPESRWHYYSGVWPSSSGLSVQMVSNIDIYQPNLISCDSSGNAKENFAPGETAYVKGAGLAASTSYKLWIQGEPVSNNKLTIVGGEDPVLQGAYEFSAGNDPSGGQETVTTNAGGDFGPVAVWAIDAAAATSTKYDIVADSQALGTVGKYDSKDYMDAPGWQGFTVAGAPVQPPVAAFTASVTSGLAPLTVTFADHSTHNPTSWAWDFTNDGTVDSTTRNPTHTYTAAGSYTVKLTATNSIGSDSEVKAGYIVVTAPPVPVAAFTADVVSGTAPLTVQFTDQSTNNPTAWAWDFDNDGDVDSAEQDPSHTYDAAGTYSVKLTVSNIAGSDAEVKAGYITVAAPPLPVAAFTADVTSGYAPLTVRFTDQSTNSPTSWAWDFDDDGTVDSTEQNPAHSYDAAGTYTVTLTATNSTGNDSETKADFITVTAPPLPVAAFTVDVIGGAAPLTVRFTDQSTGNPTAWAWDFDDDGTVDSTAQNPAHTYDAVGTYAVRLTVTNLTGSDDEVKTDYITVTTALLWGPYVTGTTTSSSVVNAKANVATTVTVQYATEAYYIANGSYDQTASDGADAQLHHVALSGLDPDTVYHYRILFGTGASGDCRFRTFPASGPVNFVVLSDTQDQLPLFSQSERFKLVADSIAAQPDVAFVLIDGDLVNDGSDLANWDRFFGAGRDMLAGTTLFTALGNHEGNDALYYQIFGLPEYYSFDCGDIHFTVLDSNMNVSAQTAWLDADLDTDRAWKFVACHHPLYTSDPNHFGGYANLRAEWEGLFQTHSVDAVWNGHMHAYERYLEGGIQYLVLGTGGGPLYQLGEEKYDGHQNSLENSLAYARVAIDPAGGTCTVDIVRVADVSADNSEVTSMYPQNTVFETMVITHGQPDWDLNNDHVCNIGDVVVIGLHWEETGDPGWIPEDLNRNGVIDTMDVAVVGLYWGRTW